jgi:hypothetical protein
MKIVIKAEWFGVWPRYWPVGAVVVFGCDETSLRANVDPS